MQKPYGNIEQYQDQQKLLDIYSVAVCVCFIFGKQHVNQKLVLEFTSIFCFNFFSLLCCVLVLRVSLFYVGYNSSAKHFTRNVSLWIFAIFILSFQEMGMQSIAFANGMELKVCWLWIKPKMLGTKTNSISYILNNSLKFSLAYNFFDFILFYYCVLFEENKCRWKNYMKNKTIGYCFISASSIIATIF